MTITYPIADILVVGLGAIGAMYSLILRRSGMVRVTVVARSNYEYVKDEGLSFRSIKYGQIDGWKPDRVCQSVAEAGDRQYAYVFVTTKAIPELAQTPKILEPLLSKPYTDLYAQPIYILMQNGLNVERELYESLKRLGKGEPKIISAAVWTCANLTAPNVVQHTAFDKLVIGVYRHCDYLTSCNKPEEQVLLDDIAEVFLRGGSIVEVVPEIQRMKFTKNFWNVAFASYATLTGFTLSAIFRPRSACSGDVTLPHVHPVSADLIEAYTIPTLRATLDELLQLGRAMGFPDTEDALPSSVVDTSLKTIRAMYEKPETNHKPSMLLDAEQGNPIEVEVILGEVVRMGKELNVPLPHVDTLYALLLVVQNQLLRKCDSEVRNKRLTKSSTIEAHK